MAQWLVAATVTLLFLSPGYARCDESASLDSATAESAVEARSRAWIKTELDGDADAFRAFATDGYIQLYVEPKTPPHPARWVSKTREQWAEEIRTKQVKYHSVVLRNTKVRLNGDIAFFTGEYTEKVLRDGAEYTESGFFAETWVKRNGQWFAVSSFFP
jgi:ketosteroid isomerase-like protein